MGKIFTIASQKGGVGKTTTALNLGYSLSRFGERVLVVDGDPQGGIAIASNLKKQTHLGLLHALKNECKPDDIVIFSKDKTMAFVGAGTMGQEDVLLFEDEAKKGSLGKLITTIAQGFDYTFIDVAGGVGNTVISMLKISDRVIPVLQPRTLSIRSVPSFLKMIQWVIRNFNSKLQMEGILFTMVDERSPLEIKLLDDFRKNLREEIFLKTIIPYNEKFEKASMRSIPLAMLMDGQEGAHSYMQLAMELKERELLSGRRDKEEEEHVTGLF